MSSAPTPSIAPPAKTISRKRRNVLWLYNEDYEYLSKIAANDGDSKNVSMRRLIKMLRRAGIDSFAKLNLHLVL